MLETLYHLKLYCWETILSDVEIEITKLLLTFKYNANSFDLVFDEMTEVWVKVIIMVCQTQRQNNKIIITIQWPILHVHSSSWIRPRFCRVSWHKSRIFDKGNSTRWVKMISYQLCIYFYSSWDQF